MDLVPPLLISLCKSYLLRQGDQAAFSGKENDEM